jgi:hypothetical protein
MRCSQFLAFYSDFRDGVLGDPRLARRVTQHVTSCRRCARYHQAVTQGADLLRNIDGPEPSEGFWPRLRQQLIEEHAHRNRPPVATPRFAATLMLAAAVAMFIGEGPTQAENQSPASQRSSRPMPMVTANPGPPFVGFAELSLPTIGTSTVQPPPPPDLKPRVLDEPRLRDIEPVTLATWTIGPR